MVVRGGNVLVAIWTVWVLGSLGLEYCNTHEDTNKSNIGRHMFILKPVSYPLRLSVFRAELTKLESSCTVTEKVLSNKAHLVLCPLKVRPSA